MAKTTRLLQAARLIPGTGLLALLGLSPSLAGAPVAVRDVPGAPATASSSTLGAAPVVAGKAATAPTSPVHVAGVADTNVPPVATLVAVAAPAPAPAPSPAAAPAPAVGGSWAGTTAAAPTAPAPGGAAPAGGAAGPAGRAHRGSIGCLIGPERSADIGSAVTGVVASITVDRGDSVRRGQTLVVLEHGVEQANLQAVTARHAIEADIRSAEASLALARERHERFASLIDSGAIPLLTAEQAKAEYDVARQRLQQARGQRQVIRQELGVARAQLAQRTLKAPFDGVVVERLSHEGERVEEKPLLRVAQLDPLRVELVMPAARWGSVRAGDAMAIVPELPAAGRLVAKVTHIDRTLDAASNTFRVRLSLPNPQHRIPAGARCRLDAPDDLAGKPADGLPVAGPIGGPPAAASSGGPPAAASSGGPPATAPSGDAAVPEAAPVAAPPPRRRSAA